MKMRAAVALFSILATFSVGVAAERKSFVANPNQAGVQQVEVVAGSYYFDPNRIVVKRGIPVELKIRKDGVVPHDFTLRAPEAGVDLSEALAKEPRTLRFTFTKVGTYSFYCSKKVPLLGSHQEKGMEGVFEVVE